MSKQALRFLFMMCTISLLVMLTVENAQGKTMRKGRSYFESLGVVWDVPTKQKVIALTFDDGPNPRYTPQILNLLEKYHAKATFFVTGYRVNKYPEIVKREVLEGHIVGNHTYNHPNIARSSPDKISGELAKSEKLIYSITKQKPQFFRPPYGYYDERVVYTAKQSGYTVVLWSFEQDTLDWKKPGVRKIVKKVVSNVRNGDIILFHDHIQNRSQTVQALKQILPTLQKRGYKFVTVSELIQIKDLEIKKEINWNEIIGP